MTATAHAIIGVIIAAKLSNPYIAVPIAILSHLAADLVPHWDVGTHEEKKTQKRVLIDAFLDVVLGFVISYCVLQLFFPNTNKLYAFLLIICAQGFDWIWAPYYFFKSKFPLSVWIYNISVKYFDNRLDKPWGIVTQVIVVLLLLAVAIYV